MTPRSGFLLLLSVAAMTGCADPSPSPDGLEVRDAPEDPPRPVLPPPRILPTFPSVEGPRMLAIVGGTLRYDRGCFFVGGDENEGPRRLVIWPEGASSGEDADGPYVDIITTKLRPGDIFTSGGGEVWPGGIEFPEDCRTERVVIAYSPRRADPPGAPYPEPPPPPAPPEPQAPAQ